MVNVRSPIPIQLSCEHPYVGRFATSSSYATLSRTIARSTFRLVKSCPRCSAAPRRRLQSSASAGFAARRHAPQPPQVNAVVARVRLAETQQVLGFAAVVSVRFAAMDLAPLVLDASVALPPVRPAQACNALYAAADWALLEAVVPKTGIVAQPSASHRRLLFSSRFTAVTCACWLRSGAGRRAAWAADGRAACGIDCGRSHRCSLRHRHRVVRDRAPDCPPHLRAFALQYVPPRAV